MTSLSRHIPGTAANVLPLRLVVHPSMNVREAINPANEQIRALLIHQHCHMIDLRDGGQTVNIRRTWGPAVNFMRFDYDLSFAGAQGWAQNLAHGPIDDLEI